MKATLRKFVWILSFLPLVTQAREMNCVSYRESCHYKLSLPSLNSPGKIVVLRNSTEECKLTGGQEIILSPTAASSSEWVDFEGHSSRDRRFIKLHFEKNMLDRARFDASLAISLEDQQYIFVNTMISCR